MSSRNQESQAQFIALNKLKKSPRNVRQTPHTKTHIAALADSINAHGQIQNLVVETEMGEDGKASGFCLVTVGEGRRLAHLLRLKRKQIKADELIRCVVDDTHNAQAVSLAENELRQNMHPADQFVAFKQLVDGGESIEQTAAHFGVTPLVVQRRLKLANVAPEFIALYRKDSIGLDLLMALAISDDHEKQRKVWKGLPKYDRHPDSVRRALTEHEIAASESIVKFVGIKAYEKAGGSIRRDLFAEDDGDGYVTDPELLRRLAAEMLEKAASKLKEDGCAWVEVIPQLDYATLSSFGRTQNTKRAATPKEQSQLNALKSEQEELEEQCLAAEDDEERYAQLEEQAEQIAARIEALDEQLRIPDPRQQALAGAIVSIGRGGDLEIKEGLLKPEDAKRFAREAKAAIKSISPTEPRLHSAALTRRLTAHRTLALQAALASRPDVALVAVTHLLMIQMFYEGDHSVASALDITAHTARLALYAPDVESSKAQTALTEIANGLREPLPSDPVALFDWLLLQRQEQVLRWCAYCVATTLDGVSDNENTHALDALARAAGLDMREWWTPTADNYFGSVPKVRVLEAVREAISPEIAGALKDLKKGALAKAAEQRLAGTGWLPAFLRPQAG